MSCRVLLNGYLLILLDQTSGRAEVMINWNQLLLGRFDWALHYLNAIWQDIAKPLQPQCNLSIFHSKSVSPNNLSGDAKGEANADFDWFTRTLKETEDLPCRLFCKKKPWTRANVIFSEDLIKEIVHKIDLAKSHILKLLRCRKGNFDLKLKKWV